MCIVVRLNLYDGLYKRSSVCVREFLDKDSPFMQEASATMGKQVR